MKKEMLEEVVYDQSENLKKKASGLSRQVDIKKLLSTKQIVVVSGIRRSGKSTLLIQLMQHFDNFYYLNFDDERLINFNISDFRELMIIYQKKYKSKTIFFDEIQNVSGWEHFIRRIYDEGYKVFITGSNAKLLSSELATHLTGRYIKIELYPFSFNEILDWYSVDYTKPTTENKARLLYYFDRYLYEGGFPEMIKYEDNEFLKRIYEDIIYKDLIVRHKIRNLKAFKNLSLYLFTNFAKELSYNSLKNILNIKSTNSIKDYVSFLEESYLIFELYKYDYSLKKQYISNKKIYVIDNGVQKTISFSFSNDKGRLLENLVFVELKRRGKEIYFFKSKNNKEVDFLYYENKQFYLIQVSYSLSDYKTKQREITGLLEANKELPNCHNIILSYNEENITETGNTTIEIIPVHKWLLNANQY
ncbi:MAG: ATP-binding protein [Bacteroidales bacterium]|nr:ATP-binding protein [Bacteroidales bacterium]